MSFLFYFANFNSKCGITKLQVIGHYLLCSMILFNWEALELITSGVHSD